MAINNIDKFRAKMARGEVCIGTNVSFTDPAISELFGDAGCDFTWIDMEHCPIDISTTLGHVMAVRGTNAAPFIRVPSGDVDTIKPILELHPAAIIVPQVRTPEEVQKIVAACKYPPLGIRGFGPRRGRGFGGIPYPEYLRDADEQILVFVQIEHIDAVEAIDEILAVQGLDGVCLGFNDLAGSMGLPGQTTHPDVLEAAERVIARTTQTEKWMGISMGYDPEAVRRWIGLGVQWIGLGSDFHTLYNHTKKMLDAVRSAD
ncbi:MAG: HpcH/HpaI aldolase family protein [Candidatus Latescibacterota bacterium]|jgi:2-keto-3-deoxy-L-rhamnonate aldolase RhmA